MHLRKWLPLSTVLFSSSYSHADELSQEVTAILEQRAAVGVLLSDKDAIAFGIADFDPNKLLGTSISGLGNATSISERRNKTVFVLPYSRELESTNLSYKSRLQFRAYYIDSKSDFFFDQQSSEKDIFEEQTSGLVLGYFIDYDFQKNLSVNLGADFHYLNYNNEFTANSILGELFSGLFDEVLLNTSANSFIASPKIGMTYHGVNDWFNYKLSTSLKAFKGVSWGDADMGDPSGTYWANEVFISRALTHSHQLFSSLKRIEVSSVLENSIGSGHYYEWTIGWLVEQPTDFSWISNLGVGVNLNYGSQLSGGSLGVYFNY